MLQPEKEVRGDTITEPASLWVMWKAGIYFFSVKRSHEKAGIKQKPHLAVFLAVL